MRYDNFFDDLLFFLKKLDLIKTDSFGLVDDHKISQFEQENQLNLDLSLRSYLQRFDDKQKVNTGIDICTLSSLKMLNNKNNRLIIEEISGIKEVGGWVERSLDAPLEEVILLDYDEVGSVYSLVEKGKENPIIFYFWLDEELTTEEFSVINTIRNKLFWKLMEINDKPIVAELEWIKFYKTLFDFEKGIKNKFILWRWQLMQELSKEEDRENRIMGIEEFEIRLIELLIKKQHGPPKL